MTGPRVELAAEVVKQLRKEAAEAEWNEDHERADRLRREADRIEARGETWEPNF
ncbi:hypothetical protein [Chenggangzhangella methanolivorans]|uniref:Uncharacterized protein n=1 Tax=Chenggangzhangella methanolivorans TaxID=1437009 RepID=A0A9E6REB9_9HYPH|nr:hypothetical protein [Chenggangzhangella methanolivorans]QZN99630.1 hypothetical protein K6K41_23520 [Chenggangzhangella methanolivorans]